MKKTIEIDHPPFSINRMTYRDKRIKTQDFKEWTANFFNKINANEENIKIFKELRDYFDVSKHFLVFELTCFYPESIFYTQEGKISAKTQDLTNVEKPIADYIINKAFYDKKNPYGTKNLNSDDKYICDLKSYKRPSDSHKLKISVEIKNLSEL